MSRSAAFLSGSAAMAVQVVVRTAGVVVVGRLLSRLAGGELLGAYSAIWQLIWLVQLLELGVSQAIVREVGQQWSRPDGDEVRVQLPRTSMGVLLLIGVAMGAALAVAAWTLPSWFRASPPVLRSASVAVAVAAAWMPLRFPLSFFSLFLFSRQRLALHGTLTTLTEVLRVSLTITLVWAGWGLPGMMLATVAAEAANYGAAWYAVRGDLPLRRLAGRLRLAEVARLAKVGVPLGLMSLGDRLAIFSQELVVGAVAGARAASEFYSTRLPGLLVTLTLVQLLYTLAPGLNDLYGRGLHDAFRRAHLRLATYAAGVGLWAAAGIVVFTPTLVALWVGPGFFLGTRMTAAVALLAAVAPFKLVCSQFAVVLGRVRVYTALVLVEGVLAVALSFALGSRLGPASVMWASAAAYSLSIPYLVALSGSLHGVKPLAFLRRVAAGALRCAAPGAAACALYAALSPLGAAAHPLVALAGLALAVAIGAAGFVQLGLFPEDRRAVHDFVRRKVLRRVAEQHA